MKPILILKTGSTFPDIADKYGDFEDWIIKFSQMPPARFHTFDVHHQKEFPDISEYCGIIITGSHAMVTDKEDWSEATAQWLRNLSETEIPVLGICHGHQLLAHALNGTVDYNPNGKEFGICRIRLAESSVHDELFGQISGLNYVAESHEQSVLQLPPNAVILASNEHDSVQAFRWKDHIWGVQFHPEFSEEILMAYAGQQKEKLNQEKNPPDISASHNLLKAFVGICHHSQFKESKR